MHQLTEPFGEKVVHGYWCGACVCDFNARECKLLGLASANMVTGIIINSYSDIYTYKMKFKERVENQKTTSSHKYRKCGDLEEELKNVTNNLKSLEAQADKVNLFKSLCHLLHPD